MPSGHKDLGDDKTLRAAAPFILVTVFLDMLCIGIIAPVLPQLILSFVGSSVSVASLWTGVFGCVWGLAQFFFSPIQGALSDHFGRRPVVLASNFGSGVDLIFMAVAPNLWWLLIGRVVSGITAASISTAYAYMSDVTEPHQRARVFGWMGASFGASFIMGPTLSAGLVLVAPGVGTALGTVGHAIGASGLSAWLISFSRHPEIVVQRLPFVVAGALSLINFLYGFYVLPESLPPEKRQAFSLHTANPIGAVKFLSRSRQVLRLAVMYLVIYFAQSVFPTTFVLYAKYRFNWGPSQVAMCLAAIGIMTGAVQGGLTGRVVKAVGERNAMFIGLLCGAAAFLGYALTPTWWAFVLFLPVSSLWGLAAPNIQALMSANVDPKEQGVLQGSNASLSSAANIVAPLAFGALLAYVTRPGVQPILSGACFAVAGLCLLATLWLGLGVRQGMKPTSSQASGSPEPNALSPDHTLAPRRSRSGTDQV